MIIVVGHSADQISASRAPGRRRTHLSEHTGQLLSSWDRSRTYRVTDYDGRRPDWGKHIIDWSVVPPPLVEVFRNGVALELRWLTTLTARTRQFQKKIPRLAPTYYLSIP